MRYTNHALIRSYRSRKDRYTKVLEKELEKVRSHEAVLMQENDRLRTVVQELSGVLSQSGLHHSPGLDRDRGLVGADQKYQQMLAYPSPPQSMGNISVEGRFSSDFNLQPKSPAGRLVSCDDTSRLCDVNLTTTGMDFVLTYVLCSHSLSVTIGKI